MRLCACHRTGARLPLHSAGDHMDPACHHSMLYFEVVIMPMLARCYVQRQRRGRTFVDRNGAASRRALYFPREKPIPIPVVYRPTGGVRGRRSVAA